MSLRFAEPGRSAMPRPFLKWAGGKRELIPEILPELLRGLPKAPLDLYIEPFLGGGAVFCELARLGRIGRAILGDRNLELVDTWRAVQTQPEALHAAFGQWGTTEAEYYEVRALDPAALSPLDRAARVLYLNRRGFNGLYRLNRSGGFNVPYGRYATPPRLDLDNLMAVHRALQGVELVQGDFDAVLERVEPGATVYCDPPYWPTSATANFNFYDGLVFGAAEQSRLAETFRGLAGRGARGVLSNSDVPATRALYAGLKLRAVLCRRQINSKVDARGQVSELLVRSGV